jgi:hypothetical protein
MSTTPSGEPPTSETTPTSPQRPSFGSIGSSGDLARLPIPGNAEFLLYALVEIIFAILWWVDDDISVQDWMLFTTVLTAFYFVSRGIAKASRVLEQ